MKLIVTAKSDSLTLSMVCYGYATQKYVTCRESVKTYLRRKPKMVNLNLLLSKNYLQLYVSY